LELNALLMALGVNEKVILVGHSYGGLCAQHFARLYPEKISGLLLVDSTSVNFKRLNELDLPTLNEQDSDEKWIEMCKRFSTMTRESIQEELKPELTEKEKEFPVEIHQRLLDFKTNSNLFKAMGSEVENWGDDADEIRKLDTFPDIPLKVIGRDAEYIVELQMKRGLPEWEVRELERVWRDLILEQAKLSNKGELVFAKDAGHAIHIDRPDVIIDSIRSLLYEQMK
jgi:pimeloyl-ACP methyl ester carboxylesterase